MLPVPYPTEKTLSPLAPSSLLVGVIVIFIEICNVLEAFGFNAPINLLGRSLTNGFIYGTFRGKPIKFDKFQLSDSVCLSLSSSFSV